MPRERAQLGKQNMTRIRLKRTMLSAAVFVGIVSVLIASSGAPVAASDLREELARLVKTPAGCSAVRLRLKLLQSQNRDVYFAFAGRKDTTISGIRGCGYSWFQPSKAKAEAIALENCKNMEARYGTDGGRKTCHLIGL